MQALKPIALPSIHEEVQNHIKEYILANHLQPGDPLPSEPQLADQLGVSRSGVREALRSLESLGVIYSRRGAGRFVNDFNMDPILHNLSYGMLFDTEQLDEIIAVRERLEAGFIADAIEAMDGDTLKQLQGLIDSMHQKIATREDFLAEDLEFHRGIYRVTGNSLLIKLLDIFRSVYQQLHDQSLHVSLDPQDEWQNHNAILQAIEAKDVELARQRLNIHFEGIKERLRTARLVNGNMTRKTR